MGDEFDFDAWCLKFRLRKDTIEKLVKESFTDEITLPYLLCDAELLKPLKLNGGELIRLRRAVASTFENEIRVINLEINPGQAVPTQIPVVPNIPVKPEPVDPSSLVGATGGLPPPTGTPAQITPPLPTPGHAFVPPTPPVGAQLPSVSNPSLPGTPSFALPPPLAGFGGPHLPVQQPPNFLTTSSLAADRQLNAQVDAYLGNGVFTTSHDLLVLGDLRQQNQQATSSTPTTSSGELKEKEAKPLLIGDFLSSNFKVSYMNHENEVKVPLSNNAEIVVKNRFKKPAVTEYTPEIWNAANYRILQYLIRIGTSISVLFAYIEYSQMISDYLNLYDPKGVYMLDFEHRWSVVKERRPWNLISYHDKDRYLMYQHAKDAQLQKQLNESSVCPTCGKSTNPDSSKKNRKGRGGKPRLQKVLDDEGKPICFNYNLSHGCNANPPGSCGFSHHCISCKGTHSKMDCPQLPPRLRGK